MVAFAFGVTLGFVVALGFAVAFGFSVGRADGFGVAFAAPFVI